MPPLIPVHAYFMLLLLWAEVCGKPDGWLQLSSAAASEGSGKESALIFY